MSESFRVEPDGLYWSIWWGPTLISTEWTTREGAQHHCDILEALRQLEGATDYRGAFLRLMRAWAAFRDARQKGRE